MTESVDEIVKRNRHACGSSGFTFCRYKYNVLSLNLVELIGFLVAVPENPTGYLDVNDLSEEMARAVQRKRSQPDFDTLVTLILEPGKIVTLRANPDQLIIPYRFWRLGKCSRVEPATYFQHINPSTTSFAEDPGQCHGPA